MTAAARVILSIASLTPESGGPARSLTGLASGLAQTGLDTHLLSLDYGRRFGAAVLPSAAVQLHLLPCPGRLRQTLRWQPQFTATLRGLLQPAHSILHDNGVWLGNNLLAARVARQLSKPLVISPRGMLSAWALSQGRLKKRLAWWFFQHAALQQAAVLHATSADEAQEMRALGLRAPIAVVANGVELPEPRQPEVRPPGRTRIALFLSRVHPKKGLPLLIEAWTAVRPVGWKLRIVGPDEGDHAAVIGRLAQAAGIADQVEFAGAVGGADRWREYRQADLFVLPSHSENFGLVIAEAMACGLPVITTTATPWAALLSENAGWWVEPQAQPLTLALGEAVKLGDAQLQQMGRRGERHVRREFSYARVAGLMAELYGWVLDRGPRPHFMHLD